MHGLFSFFLLQILLKKSIILFRLMFSRSLFMLERTYLKNGGMKWLKVIKIVIPMRT